MLPGETIASGAPTCCKACGEEVGPLAVYHSFAGYYIGTYCGCGPYSRESGYYRAHEAAEEVLESGAFGR